MGRIDQVFRSLRPALVDYTKRRIAMADAPRGPADGGAALFTSLPDITIVGYTRVVTKYGNCNIINYSATRYKDYSVTKCNNCIVTRFTKLAIRDLTNN